MAKISILTAKVTQPEDPALISDIWKLVNYRESAYDRVGEIKFNASIPARHVAVYSENEQPLTLVEVEVYGKCKIIKLSAFQGIYIFFIHYL